ncbi:MAG: anthranilate synthase component I [Rhodospirillaceae bacterium]|nr:anthranilate synthase component I [Rhodospirillaceae bacterium]|tara:strand:- start:735 stop:2246 length:1512 start_codon:yes stop_codon:yes gene_type:complete
MSDQPSQDEFSKVYNDGLPQVVWTTLVADLETPVSAMLKLTDGRANAFLLESVEGGKVRGRFSIIGMNPDLIWKFSKKMAQINRRARMDPNAFEDCSEYPLQSLRALVNESRIELPKNLPPMASGLFGYMGYDAVRLSEKIPDENPDDLGVPDGLFLRPSLICIFDRLEDIVTIVTPVWPDPGISSVAAYEAAQTRLKDAVSDFQRSLPFRRETSPIDPTNAEPISNTSRNEFHDMVERAKEYINAGDIFQVVPSQRFSIPFDLPPVALYRSLRRLNPSPYLFFFDFGAFSIVGSSPEILVTLRDTKVTLRPLAGTRKRGANHEQDKALAKELLEDPKERAEHLMLLDLGRNDVGRVSKVGSVNVIEQFSIEYYSHVMHIASHIEGTIQDNLDALDALAAGFPAGTVSGAPKVRAMEIIDELEKSRRGVYAGAVGYFSANGTMDTCIALRTALVKDGIMYVQAGGGVVADSDPESEYQESVNKARALFRAAQQAVEFAAQRNK